MSTAKPAMTAAETELAKRIYFIKTWIVVKFSGQDEKTGCEGGLYKSELAVLRELLKTTVPDTNEELDALIERAKKLAVFQ